MGDKKICYYVNRLNSLYKETGLLIESDTMLFEVNESKSKNKVVAEIVWDNEDRKYNYIKRN